MEDNLYKLIGQLFVEGHDMRAQLLKLNNLIKTKDDELGKLHADLHKANTRIKALKDGQESA